MKNDPLASGCAVTSSFQVARREMKCDAEKRWTPQVTWDLKPPAFESASPASVMLAQGMILRIWLMGLSARRGCITASTSEVGRKWVRDTIMIGWIMLIRVNKIGIVS